MKKKVYLTALLIACILSALGIKIYGTKPFDPDSHSWKYTLEQYNGDVESILARKCDAYQFLVEKTLTYRANTIKLAQSLRDNETPFSGADLDELNQGTYKHLMLREQLMEIALAHESWLNAPESLLRKHGITPELKLKGMMLSISASLLLYDNYLLAISLFEDEAKLRQFINQEDRGYQIESDKLAEITLSYNSAAKRERLRKAIHLYEKQWDSLGSNIRNNDQIAYLDLLIRNSPSYAMIRDYAPLTVLSSKLSFLEAITNDKLKKLSQEGLSIFSMLFGNTMGLVETRKGKLYDKPTITTEIRTKLRAGDILLEKTPFRLTDKLIPGHWGHAAIWVGTEAELKELGIWEHEVVRPYHSRIREGKLIAEALRSGVELNTLDTFLNVDDFALLRNQPSKSSKEENAARLILAFRQIGKPYDFNFDVETTSSIVCSELCYVVWTDIDWPTENTLGRATISPDNVASKAINGPLVLELFYHDGELIQNNPLTKMASLMNADSMK